MKKWLIIAGIILLVLAGIAVAGRMNLIPFVNEMKDLQKQNEALKRQAAENEKTYQAALQDKEKRIVAIDKKIADLQKKNAQLVKANSELEKKRSDLEKKYEDLKGKLANIQVPADRAARAAMFRKLGY